MHAKLEPFPEPNAILIVRRSEARPHEGLGAASDVIPRVVVEQLSGIVAETGCTLSIRDCAGDAQVIEWLGRANAMRAAFVLFDPGSAPHQDLRYQAALAGLRMPFIEVHDDRAVAEPDLSRAGGGRARNAAVARIHGYASQGYVMALWIALDRLGLADRGDRYHVGT